MTRFIVLRDSSGNWHRPSVPSLQTVAPREPGAPGTPVVEALELSPEALREAARDPALLGITPVMPTRLLSPEPVDALRDDDLPEDWGQKAVAADRTPFDGAGARIAILDTGIDRTHPCFREVSLTTRDFAGTGVDDANGHGTHVAGTVLGRDLDGHRVGVAQGVSDLLIGKTLTDNGTGRSDTFFDAIFWAREQGADAIGFSLALDTVAHVAELMAQGYPATLANSAAVNAYRGNLRILENTLAMMGDDGRPLLLGAVGNDSMRMVSGEFETGPAAPAAASGVLAVGALGPTESGFEPAPFSNMSPDLVAPGMGILSAAPGGGTRCQNGTSMAMAHALGVAALWAQKLRTEARPVNAQTLAQCLIDNATRSPDHGTGGVIDQGKGMIQAPV